MSKALLPYAEDRFHKAGKFEGCPNVKMLMEGSLNDARTSNQFLHMGLTALVAWAYSLLKDRNKALREWVAFGGNAAQMEAKLSFERTSSVLGQRVWEQVAVKDMRHPPYSFSKLPGVDFNAVHVLCVSTNSCNDNSSSVAAGTHHLPH